LSGEDIFDVERGRSQEVTIETLRIHKFSELTIPGTVIRGREDGPRLLFIAGIHGDELNGVAIVRRLIRFCQGQDIAGTVIGIPVANVWGVLSHTRYMIDGRDLNRSFPGSREGSYTSRVADSVFRIAERCDYVVDFHSASGGRSNIPQIRADMGDRDTAGISKAFGTACIYNHKGVEGTLRRELVEKGVPAILYEGGEQERFEELPVEIGVAGALNVMAYAEMLDRDIAEPPCRLVLDKARWIRSSVGGIVERKMEAGSYVSPGATVAEITDIFGGRPEQITYDKEGVVIGVTHRPVATPGSPIAHILELEGMDEETSELIRRGAVNLTCK
jgi:hypothetical protein